MYLRNDDRTFDNPNPLIDAPLTASGGMFLVVENIEPEASALSYQLHTTLP